MAKNEDDLELQNLQRLPELKEIKKDLDNSSGEEKIQIFKEYTLSLVNAARSGFVNMQTAAFSIADYLEDIELCSDEDINELLWSAKVLELPFEEAYGSREEYISEWSRFSRKVREWAK